MLVLKVKVISLPYIFQVLYVLCFTRPRYQVSVYRTIGPLAVFSGQCFRIFEIQMFVAAKFVVHDVETTCMHALQKNANSDNLWVSLDPCLISQLFGTPRGKNCQ